MQRIKRSTPAHLRKRATTLSVSAGNTYTCSTMGISWDASKGSGPWTVLVAPINQLPIVFDVASASGSSFTYNWPVPNYTATTQAIVAVVDATGNYAGTSQFVNLVPASSTCSGPNTAMDFVWFPTSSKTPPTQCQDWGVTYQVDSSDSGVEGDVSFTFLPENGQPFTVDAGTASGNSASLTWQMGIAAGTRFAVVANDQGQTGTGGVGDLYQVSSGGSTSCSLQNVAVKLPPATQTVTASSSSTTSSSTTSSSSSTSHSSTTSPQTTSHSSSSTAAAQPTFSSGQNTSAGGSHGSGSKAGTAVGAAVGVIAGLLLLAVLFLCIRRKRRRDMDEKARDPYGVNPNPQMVTPWRWSATGNGGSQGTTRTQRWFQRNSQGPAETFDSVGFRGNPDESFHSRQASYASGSNMGAHGNMGTLRSAPHNRDDFVLSTIASSGMIEQDARSSMPSYGSQYGSHGPAYPSTVPDASLFPPPPPAMHARAGDSYSRHNPNVSPFDDPSPGINAGVGTFQGVVPGGFFDDGGSRYPATFDAQQQHRGETVRSPEVAMSPSSSSSSHMGGRVPRKQVSPADAAFAHPINHEHPTEYLAPIDAGRNSVFDPFKQQMQDYSRGSGPNDAAAFASHGVPRRAPSPPQVTSEVLMMNAPEYRGRVASPRERNTTTTHVNEEDDAQLPYL